MASLSFLHRQSPAAATHRLPAWSRRLLEMAGRGRSSLAGASCGPIGIDFARDRLHLAQVEFRGGTPLLRAAASLPYGGERTSVLADPARARALLLRARAAAPFSGHRAVSCLPSDAVRLMVLGFGLGENRDPATAIVAELRERLKDDLAGSVVDYLLIRSADGSDSQNRSAIVAVARRPEVEAHLGLLDSAGFDVQALDIAPAALCRLATRSRHSSQTSHALMITLGIERSYFTVLWGRRLMLDRGVDFGENTLLDRVSRALDVDRAAAAAMLRMAEDGDEVHAADSELAVLTGTLAEILHPVFVRLAEEIDRTLVYVASQNRGASVERILLVGGMARYRQVVRWLNRIVRVPVDVLEPYAALGTEPPPAASSLHDAPVGIAVAAGLALRAVSGEEP